jgi:thiamine-monophosphate kinase
VGYKALASALSDVAAMGAEPLVAVASASLRREGSSRLGRAIHEGLAAASEKIGCPVVGGNVTETSGPLSVTVAAVGRVARGGAFLRKGARPGDVLFVTGELGGSGLRRHLRPAPRLEEARRLRRLGGVRAMIDVSDGLALDLWRLARASAKAAAIDAESVPVSKDAVRLARRSGRTPLEHALSDGEDYELLFAADRRAAAKIERLWRLPTRLSRIGEVLPVRRGRGGGALLLREGGETRRLAPSGFAHL